MTRKKRSRRDTEVEGKACPAAARGRPRLHIRAPARHPGAVSPPALVMLRPSRTCARFVLLFAALVPTALRAQPAARSDFPRFDVNPGTGEPLGRNRRMVTQDSTVHHSAKHPSHVVLPLAPAVR